MSVNLDELGDQFVCIQCQNSVDYVKAVFDAHKQGKIVIPLKDKTFTDYIAFLDVKTVIEPEQNTGWVSQQYGTYDPNALAQITFTSGTEGQPKPIALTHGNLADVTERLIAEMEMDASIREYVGVPVFYSFGFGRVRACGAVGGDAYIPVNGFDPMEIAQMLRENQINAISAVPSLWRILLAAPDIIGKLGAKVKWIEIGSQYMSASEKQQMIQLFPNANILQHYGLTEASRSSFLKISSCVPETLESVGRAYGDVELRISDEGRIQVKGPHVAAGILSAEGLNPLSDDGWLTTSDQGEYRDGYLYFKGRADDVINCGGVKLAPDQLEQKILSELGWDGGLGVTRIPDDIRGDGVLVALVAHDEERMRQVQSAAQYAMAALNLNVGNSLKFATVKQLPLTATGKIQRKKLSEQYLNDRQESAQSLEIQDENLTAEQQKLLTIWQHVLGIPDISIHSTFYDLGGDSLSAIQVMIQMEKEGIDSHVIHEILAGKTVAEITAQSPDDLSKARDVGTKKKIMAPEYIASEALNMTRGLFASLLIIIHWMPGLWNRLPVNPDVWNYYLNPLYRFGTPSFSVVFGLGVGFYYFHQLENNRGKGLKNIRLSASLIFGGICLLAFFRFIYLEYMGAWDKIDNGIVYLFYSVLTFYFLAVVTIPLWYLMVSKAKNKSLWLLVMSAVFYLIGAEISEIITAADYSGILRLLVLMIEAKYDYFSMAGNVLMAASIGYHFRQNVANPGHAQLHLGLGVALIAIGFAFALDAGNIESWFTTSIVPMWALFVYSGVVLLGFTLFNFIAHAEIRNRVIVLFLRILAVLGLLSLPMYVTHELVIPFFKILDVSGLKTVLALGASVSAFFGIIGFFAFKLYRLKY